MSPLIKLMISVNLIYLKFLLTIVYTREKLSTTLDSVYKSSDPYIKMRSFYVQNRRAKVYNNKYNEVLKIKKRIKHLKNYYSKNLKNIYFCYYCSNIFLFLSLQANANNIKKS